MKKIRRGIMFLTLVSFAFLISNFLLINVNAKTLKSVLNGDLIHEVNYPNMSIVKNGDN